MPDKLTELEIAELNIEQRLGFASEWLNAAEQIAKKAKHPEAKELVSYAAVNSALGVPVAGGIRDLYLSEPNPDLDYFYLTPIMPSDTDRLAPTDPRLEFLSDNPASVARFSEGSRAIYLSPVQISRLGRGLILLHELKHAVNHPSNSEPTEDEREVWLEEADVLAFEFDVLEALLGRNYQKSVDNFIRQVLIYGETIDPAKVERIFAKKFGVTEADNDFWINMYAYNAQWRFIQMNERNPREAFASLLEEENPIDFTPWD